MWNYKKGDSCPLDPLFHLHLTLSNLKELQKGDKEDTASFPRTTYMYVLSSLLTKKQKKTSLLLAQTFFSDCLASDPLLPFDRHMHIFHVLIITYGIILS